MMFPRSIKSERHKPPNNRGETDTLSSCDIVNPGFPSFEIHANNIIGSA
jgi:hypothetical protein